MSDLSIIGSPDSHDTLLEFVQQAAPCKILDVPAGKGGFALQLKKSGYNVRCADIDTGHFGVPEIPVDELNLNQNLPYESASFEAISCVNGIHRVLFPDRTIAEFSRILKPGGTLYLNVNNYSSIVKRLRFLMTGSLEEKITVPACEQTITDPEAHVRSPLMYPRIALILEQAGFEVQEVTPAAVRLRHSLLAPLAWMIRGATKLLPTRFQRKFRSDLGNAPGVFPGGLYMLVVAKKKDVPTG
jgi:SAM-dependent methyltransferase